MQATSAITVHLYYLSIFCLLLYVQIVKWIIIQNFSEIGNNIEEKFRMLQFGTAVSIGNSLILNVEWIYSGGVIINGLKPWGGQSEKLITMIKIIIEQFNGKKNISYDKLLYNDIVCIILETRFRFTWGCNLWN